MTTHVEYYTPKTIEDVKTYLEELSKIREGRHLFEWTQSEDMVKAKLKQYLGDKSKFAMVAAAFRKMGGTYISAGKDTHFKVQLTSEEPKIRPRRLVEISNDLYNLCSQLEDIATELKYWTEG